MKIKNFIPSFITSLNLFCGCIATVFAFQGEVKYAVILIIIAAILDFLDGFSARMLKTVSNFGKQLDSLADIISFGMAPATLMYNLVVNHSVFSGIWSFSTFLIVIFAALRLAKYNIDSNQTNEFSGLPTPAMAIFILSIAWYVDTENNCVTQLICNKYFFAGLIIFVSVLMVSKIKLFSLKFKEFSFKKNIWQIIFLILSIVLLIIFKIIGIAFIIILYLALSLLKNMFNKNKIE